MIRFGNNADARCRRAVGSIIGFVAAAALICAVSVMVHAQEAVAPQATPEQAQTPAVQTERGPTVADPSAANDPAPSQDTPEAASQPAAPHETVEAPRVPDMQVAQASPAPQMSRGQLPEELSPWRMFLAADAVVKGVMIALALGSLVVWIVWIAKSSQIYFAKMRLGQQCRLLTRAQSLSDTALVPDNRRDPVTFMIRAALTEWSRSSEGRLPADGIKSRTASELARIEVAAARQMAAGTGILATVGSTAPFVGLFGTVWGIMNSFIGISKAQTTNLAVVAPGIAEALLATAIGLVAAIPAVIFYNQISRSIAGYKAGLADAAAAVERHLSRDIDRRLARAVQSDPGVE